VKNFIDTSAFIALLIAQDDHHDSVKQCVAESLTDGVGFVTSEYILDELYTRINYDLGTIPLSKVMKYIQQAVKSRSLDLLKIDDGIFERSTKMILKYSALRLSLTDCTSFLFVKEYKLNGILTLDSDFKKLGLKVLPDRIRG